MNKITKKILSISISKHLSKFINNKTSNRSKYIEELIYDELKDKNVKGIEKIII